MSNYHYKHVQSWEKLKLEKLIGNKPTLQPIWGRTDHGMDVVDYKPLVDIKYLSKKLKREPKTIKNELIRGKYWTLSKTLQDEEKTFSYSKDASDVYHGNVIKERARQNVKLILNPKLLEFVKKHLDNHQSLKGIGGRTKIAFENKEIETTITHKTLYNYIENPNIAFITKSSLKRRRKQYYRTQKFGKRLNGTSINERLKTINERKEFGHWEIDLIEGKRGTNINLLTMCERITRKGIAMKINGKEAKTINNTIKLLQSKDVLIYGLNVKSISTDNGSEFWGWKEFSKSIWNSRDNIDVYFCNPYHSWEKGSIENFNLQLRQFFPKGTNFTNIDQAQIDSACNTINNLFRSILGYKTANEIYNQFTQS